MHFRKVVDRAENGKAVILQFHGVPDTVHPWVNTPAKMFRQYMSYLKENGFRVLALRDLGPCIDPENDTRDPVRQIRYPDARAQ